MQNQFREGVLAFMHQCLHERVIYVMGLQQDAAGFFGATGATGDLK